MTLSVVPSRVITNAEQLANGHFQFSFSGPTATSAFVLGSTNLVDWTTLQTNTPFTGTFQFEDVQASGFSKRFYRVYTQP
jgi:hypothetical protein